MVGSEDFVVVCCLFLFFGFVTMLLWFYGIILWTVVILKNGWGNYTLTVMIFIIVLILLKNEAINNIENLCLDCYNWN